MKTIYQIILDDGTTDEAQNGLKAWATGYAEMCSDDCLTPNEVKAICYDAGHREVYLSDDAVNQVNEQVSNALDDAIKSTRDHTEYQRELRADYYSSQL